MTHKVVRICQSRNNSFTFIYIFICQSMGEKKIMGVCVCVIEGSAGDKGIETEVACLVL